MLRSFRYARRNPAKTYASAFALGLAVLGSAATVNGAFATAAFAQEETSEFATLYQPVVAVVNAPDGNVASVEAQLPALVAAAEAPQEIYAAGVVMVSAGTKLDNKAYQRQGVELQIRSGQVGADRLPRFYWVLGTLAFDLEDYPAAREAFGQAASLGFTDEDAAPFIAESYFGEGNPAAGLDILTGRVDELLASGAPVPESWLLRGLNVAYSNSLVEPANELAALLVSQNATPRNWLGALQVVNAVGDFESATRLDLLRLMRETDALTSEREYAMYIDLADPRIMSNEVQDVIAAGVAGGHLTPGADWVSEITEIVENRIDADRAEAPDLVAEAETDSTGESALVAADLLYSLSDFAGAEALYAMALEKGGVDSQVARTRLGIAQVQQGKFAEAQATLDAVTGPGEIVARMWSLYAGTQTA